ncbi:helix-turn-helix domain-containing protein [Ornithinimicrobium sp. F0845]|uniref:helix-turn-helix domain-containing protein n=1 Tax=Ornithinimicrobium sp. F0845 TaxID=2926412 RepID=UPI001FF29762|nr:helix-turn-helix transcriptional regulator [Ornithinimicrobium sp. F0845]MCK0111787.1 helix-turn-helix domain-containing protein [Ornithinimicrobium sp. F0845]
MGNVVRLPDRQDPGRLGNRGRAARRGPALLWREALGRQLRGEREFRGERISDVAARAGLSPQYLSELERGKKDPSSEMLEALAGALDLTVVDLTRRAGTQLTLVQPGVRGSGPALLAA